MLASTLFLLLWITAGCVFAILACWGAWRENADITICGNSSKIMITTCSIITLASIGFCLYIWLTGDPVEFIWK